MNRTPRPRDRTRADPVHRKQALSPMMERGTPKMLGRSLRPNFQSSKASPQFWYLVVFLFLVFALGGASRIDVQSLIILRPLSIVACALALLTLKPRHLKDNKWLMLGFASVVLITLAHLIPLPPAIWQSFPGRSEVVRIDELAKLGDVWRPITLTPINGWHSFVSLFVPLTIILFGIQLNRAELFRLLPILIGLGALSGLLGIIQVIGDPRGPLYLYRITNNGSAVGLFSNRNHAATLLACLFPMLAVFASTATGSTDSQRTKQMVAVAVGIVLIPLILVTGSRSGVILTIIGLAAAMLLYRRPDLGHKVRRGDDKRKFNPLIIFGAVAIFCLGFLTIFFSRAEALNRMFSQPASEDLRAEFWPVAYELIWKYFPLGSGAGSFVEAYQIVEPGSSLSENYLNRAHNDFLETLITFGLPGIILMASIIIFYLWRCFKIWTKQDHKRRSLAFARMASLAILMIGIASFFDYPLRTPTMMSVLTLLVLWFVGAGQFDDSNGDRTPQSQGWK